MQQRWRTVTVVGDPAAHDASDKPSSPEADLAAQGLFEGMIANWIVISTGILTTGVLVHINLHYLIGIVVMGDGLALILLTMLGAALYAALPTAAYVRARRNLLYAKYAVLAVLVGLMMWAMVLMVERGTDGGSL